MYGEKTESRDAMGVVGACPCARWLSLGPRGQYVCAYRHGWTCCILTYVSEVGSPGGDGINDVSEQVQEHMLPINRVILLIAVFGFRG